VSKNKKGEPLTEIVCVGCGRAQHLRKRKIVPCDGYTCGFGGDCVKNPQFHLPAIPEGCVRHIVAKRSGRIQRIQHTFCNTRRTSSGCQSTGYSQKRKS
jgi:hypothetical protein